MPDCIGKAPPASEKIKKEVKAKKPGKAVSSKKVEKALLVPEIPIPDMDESLEDFAAKSDVSLIKHKKVKLEGIKVIGKIELPKPPEPKVEEEVEKEVEILENENKAPEKPKEKQPQGLYGEFLNKKKTIRHNKREPQKRRILSFSEKQERDKKRQEEEQKKQLRKVKQKKKQHYREKVNIESSPPVKRKVKRTKSASETKTNQAENVVKRNPLKKLWNWLNGEYDNF